MTYKMIEKIDWICCSKYIHSTVCPNVFYTEKKKNEMKKKSKKRKKTII